MTKLLVCIDGSAYADNLCANAAWVAKRMNAEIDLLHVLRRHSDYEAPASDHTGSIGLGARSELLSDLAKVDEERGRLDQQKGRIILQHGEKILRGAGVQKVNLLHRRGSFVKTLQELEHSVDMIFIGKRGEHANMESEYLGANLEKTARAIHKPLFVVSSVVRPIERFLIAYDGKDNVRKAVEYIANAPLLKGLEGHLLAVESGDAINTNESETILKDAGFDVKITHTKSKHPDEAITDYVRDHKIDLLITGAYSHSRVRTLLLGSTTASLIKACKVPLLMFR
jgi:nucleotide-binding universal stress UspA family protein